MITINASREMSAPLDRIWNVVADVDNEPEYWRGTKTVVLHPSDNHKTRIDVIWNIKLTGFLGMFTGMVKRHIAKGTDEALARIAKAVE